MVTEHLRLYQPMPTKVKVKEGDVLVDKSVNI